MQGIQSTHPRVRDLPPVVPALLVADVIVFGLAAVGHLGVAIPLGLRTLVEAPILPAAVVEGLNALVLGAVAYGALAGRAWAWRAAIAGHLFALASVALGVWSLSMGYGPRSDLNDVYHGLMVVLLTLGLTRLLAPGSAAASVREAA
jgi:hypothetical protein